MLQLRERTVVYVVRRIVRDIRAPFFFAVILLALAAGSPTRGGNYPVVIGVGGNSCGSWTAASNTPRRLEYEAWLIGYFSAVNRYAPGADGALTRSTDGRGLIGWVDNYCLAHPIDQIETAAVTLTKELRRRASK